MPTILYDSLVDKARSENVDIVEMRLSGRNRGFYGDGLILLDRRMRTYTEKTCILAEELGHYYTTVGDITDQSILSNRKQERRAREWAYNHLIPLSRIIDAHRARIRDRHNVAEYLGVTEQFLQDSINRYMDKHGLYIVVDDRYTIWFDPLSVIESFE